MEKRVIAVVGLGYVGLPLAVEFGKKFRTIGLDLSAAKIEAYRRHVDPTGEVTPEQLAAASLFEPTTDATQLQSADIVIVAVPTPIDDAHQPDFGPLISASIAVGRNLKKGATVVYESTVYPGATEEICIPVLERESKGKWKRDFFVGYSPERINPGDREHTLTRIVKVVAGDTPETLDRVARAYEQVVTAGVYRASSIKVAEAAKVIENTQRDLNIALMNELSLIFHRMDIDTLEVLQAAGTKWNFLPFRPGLVGGHCIGVDPYYLTHKADKLGYHPQVILAGRRINDNMGKYIAEQTVKHLIRRGLAGQGCTRHCARAYLQGELLRSAQLAGHRCHSRVAVVWSCRQRARPGRDSRRCAERVRRDTSHVERVTARASGRRGRGSRCVQGALARRTAREAAARAACTSM